MGGGPRDKCPNDMTVLGNVANELFLTLINLADNQVRGLGLVIVHISQKVSFQNLYFCCSFLKYTTVFITTLVFVFIGLLLFQ